MRRTIAYRLIVALTTLATLMSSASSLAQTPTPAGVGRLQQDMDGEVMHSSDHDSAPRAVNRSHSLG